MSATLSPSPRTSGGLALTRVLVVEDSAAEARGVAELLELERAFDPVIAGSLREAIARCGATRPDVVLLDLGLPDAQGLATLERFLAHCPGLPVIVLTGTDDEETALGALDRGAQDYLVKGQLGGRTLARAVRYAIERQRGDEALRVSEKRFRRLFDSGILGIFVGHPGGAVLEANDAFLRMTGYDRDELEKGLVRWDRITPPERRAADERSAAILAARGAVSPFERELLHKDGRRVPVLNAVASLDPAEGTAIAYCIDLTEKRLLEEQARHSQKMEAVGKLAGGIAHDFNNLLTVIKGWADLLAADLPAGAPGHEAAGEILEASARAAALTRQLLAFSRKQVLEPRVLDVNEAVRSVEKLLRRVIGEDVELKTVLEQRLGPVMADPVQLEQALLNLAVNARDAMPEGGRLTIETAGVELAGPYATEHLEVEPGPYVQIAVTDTGVGMDEETRAHVFEPFFTTKAKGKGTGLGLATVYGVVRQSGGHVFVYSEPGRGSTFKIYLPRLAPGAEAASPQGREAVEGAPAPAAPGTILLVEDDRAVRGLARSMLASRGWDVLVADGAEQALEILAGAKDVRLVVTDVVMPRMTGPELAARARVLKPGLKFLFISGYPDEAIVAHGVLDADAAFLAKPFSVAALAAKVKEVLEGG